MRIADFIAQTSLFDTLSGSDCDALAEKMTLRLVGPGETVFQKGDVGDSMFVVVSGALQIFLPSDDKSPVVIALKEAIKGDYFGELSLFDAKPRSATVVAKEPSEVLELRRTDFADYISRSPTAAMTIMAELAERLRETNALLSQRAARDVVKELDDKLTFGEKLADKVAELNGSWAFIGLLATITIGWAVLNGVFRPALDAYPYAFFNLLLAVLVAMQGPLIVMSQNRQSVKDRAQAETDYRVNLKNEIGIERILSDVAHLREELKHKRG
jgi:uncharacterized membrane protein